MRVRMFKEWPERINRNTAPVMWPMQCERCPAMQGGSPLPMRPEEETNRAAGTP